MDWGAIILTLVLDLILTVFFYLLVPVIFCIRKKPMTQKQIKKVVIINGICVCLLCGIIAGRVSGAVFLWSWVAKKIMERVLLTDDENDVLSEVEHVDESPTTTEQSFSDTNISQTVETKTSVADEQPVATSNKVSFCRKCGNKLLADSLYCNKCGTKVITDDQ